MLDLTDGKARRVLDGDVSTMPDKSVTVTYDGKPLRHPDGRGVEFAANGIALSGDGTRCTGRRSRAGRSTASRPITSRQA